MGERAVLTMVEAFFRRQISSASVVRRRYSWPRGPLRTSEVLAPGNFYFLQADELKGKIFDPGVVTHPGDEPSGAVPGVATRGHGPRSSRRGGEQGPDRFLVFLSGFLFVKNLDSCPIVLKAKVLLVIVPTD
jgi:hypothetical protein